MKFSAFIEANLDAILKEWEAFAKTMLPAATTMSPTELRDDGREVLLAICANMEVSQTEADRSAKSKRNRLAADAPPSAAALHGALRQRAGFNPMQVVGEFRALRASVLGAWSRSGTAGGEPWQAEEIARFNEAIDQALTESIERYSSEVSRSRDMFLAVLGHDVRGPLSGIRMATDLLLTPSLDEPARTQVVMRIRRAEGLITRLTTDLLEYTRSRLGKGIPVHRSACDLSKICEEAIDIVKSHHPERQFVNRAFGDLRLTCDIPRMQQVLANLLNNAVQHGSPSLPVSLEAEGRQDAVVIKVANFGHPIPPAALQVIFEPLVQVSSADSEPDERPNSSLGLGLYIVKEIVEAHQGRVSVVSSTEAGTVFTIELPRAAVPERG